MICNKETDNFIDTYSTLKGHKIIIHVCKAHQDMVNQAMFAEIDRLQRIQLESDM